MAYIAYTCKSSFKITEKNCQHNAPSIGPYQYQYYSCQISLFIDQLVLSNICMFKYVVVILIPAVNNKLNSTKQLI